MPVEQRAAEGGVGTVMERAALGEIELEYEVAGSGEPVVCIHGAFIADSFRPLLLEPALARPHRLIVYRRRGYGGSGPRGGPVGVARHADDCRGLLRQLGVQRAHVVGHSYGGCVALQLALDAPDIVHTLALLEPGLMVGTSGPGYRESLAQGTRRYREVGAEAVLDEFLSARWEGYRDALDRALPGAFEQAVADAETWFEREMEGQLTWRFGEAEARRITQPTLAVIGGKSEALWSRFGETQRALLEWIPHAEGFELPGAAHFLHLEQPSGGTVLAEALAAFSARHPFEPDAGG